MAEERRDARTTPPGRRFTVSEAAVRLGISAEAVRSRLKRGTLRSVKDGATVYVLLEIDQSRPDADQTPPEPDQTGDQTELVAVLREQLAEEREARRRADTIIAQLAQSNEEQARTIRAIEAPDSPRDEQNTGQETPGPGPEGSSTPGEAKPGEGNIERGGTHRGLWRRIFGGG
jgi:excisionase family DNA binding protein